MCSLGFFSFLTGIMLTGDGARSCFQILPLGIAGKDRGALQTSGPFPCVKTDLISSRLRFNGLREK